MGGGLGRGVSGEESGRVGSWRDLKSLVAAQRHWIRINREPDGFETQLPILSWNLTLRVVTTFAVSRTSR